MADSKLNLAMDPWLAMSHISYLLYLANKLAKRGYRISFFVPVRTQTKLERLSSCAALITFVPVPIPHVEGLTALRHLIHLHSGRVREIERPYIEYLKSQYGNPVLLAGSVLPEPPASTPDERWVKGLGGFKASSVVYCAFGSEYILEQQQYEELLHGLELTGMPFLAALKQPIGANSGAEASPNEIVATVIDGLSIREFLHRGGLI